MTRVLGRPNLADLTPQPPSVSDPTHVPDPPKQAERLHTHILRRTGVLSICGEAIVFRHDDHGCLRPGRAGDRGLPRCSRAYPWSRQVGRLVAGYAMPCQQFLIRPSFSAKITTNYQPYSAIPCVSVFIFLQALVCYSTLGSLIGLLGHCFLRVGFGC